MTLPRPLHTRPARVVPTVLTLSLLLGVLLSAGCKGEQRKVRTRALATKVVAGARFSLQAQLSHKHRGLHTTGGRIIRASDSYQLSLIIEARRGQKKLELLKDPHRGKSLTRRVRSWTEGEAALKAVKAETCALGDRLAWRVKGLGKGQGQGQASPWELVYLRAGYGVRTPAPATENPTAPCRQVLTSAPSWEAWRDVEAGVKQVCQRLAADKTHLAAARCMLRDKGNMYGEGITSPKMRAAVLEALAPDPRWDAQQWNEGAIGATLAKLDRGQVRALVDKTVAHCSKAGVTCAAWRLGGIARAARQLGGEVCPPLLQLAAQRLEQPGEEDAQAALLILRQIFRCVDERQLAPVMRKGLSRLSTPEHKLRSADSWAYSLTGGRCADRDLRRTFSRGQGFSMCESIARFSGSWLGLHCDAEAVKAGLQAAGSGKLELDPRTNQVLDGALRLLGWCDPKAFEQAIANASEDSPTPALADSRGKKKLRAFFLHAK